MLKILVGELEARERSTIPIKDGGSWLSDMPTTVLLLQRA